MRTIIREIQTTFKGFVNGSRYRMMIVYCAPEHSPLILKSLDAIEEDPASPDIFLTFGYDFADSASYVAQVLANLREQHRNVNEELTQRGESPLAPLPAENEEATEQPEARLASAAQSVRQIIPRGRQVIWIFYPLEIGDPEQYAALLVHLRQQIEAMPLRATKLIARESPGFLITKQLKNDEKVRIYNPALAPDSLMRQLNEQANDPQVPPAEQAQNHMMLAGMDIAQGRYDTALARNQELLGYFTFTGERQNQSMIHNNIGDIYYMQKRYPEAQQSYEQAVTIAVAEQSQPLVIYQSINLGNSLLMQGKYEEALVYYDAAEQLAEVNSVLMYQLQALEQKGIAHHRLEQLDKAAEAWEKGVEMRRRFEYDPGIRPFLERLRDLYQETGDSERAGECQRALDEAMVAQQAN